MIQAALLSRKLTIIARFTCETTSNFDDIRRNVEYKIRPNGELSMKIAFYKRVDNLECIGDEMGDFLFYHNGILVHASMILVILQNYQD